jgi:5-methyltetrahydropteroyltriglutamate--homocysteine methyltransferase
MGLMYRADHVGSLLRPRELLDARNNPDITAENLIALEDKHIQRVLERQKELGFRIFSDGELRRRGFMSDFYDSVEGLDTGGEIARTWRAASVGAGGGSRVASLAGVVVEKIRQTKRLTSHETAFLNKNKLGDIKMTLPTANQFPAIIYKKGMSERAYATRSELLWDIVPVIKAEIQALANEGVKYIQLDAPRYSYYIDPKWRGYVKDEMGMDPEEALDEAIRADNACLEGIRREGLVVAFHLCRGNHRSHWYAEGGYDPIADKLLNQLNVDIFLLEYESERAGSFEPLRFVPRDKGVVLGLISSKLPALEPRDQIIRRIEEAAKYVPLDRMALSPQCGFASSMEGNLLTEEDQWAKLGLVVDTARQVWKDA